MPTTTDEKTLLDNACHLGHPTNKWNPRMAPYLYGSRKGIHIFDLEQTKTHLEELCNIMQKLHAEGKQVLFVSTKQQSIPMIEDIGDSLGNPVVTKKWIPGLLTNWNTIKERLKYYLDLQESFRSGEVEKYTKKEQVSLRKKLTKLDAALSGVSHMKRIPDALFVVDGVRDQVAIAEARKLKIPVYGICDSNANPDDFTHFVPANDDAVKSLMLILSAVKEAMSGASAAAKSSPQIMTDVSATAVFALRKRTGVSIIECKKALEEANGDEDKAIEMLRKRGVAQAAKKADRDQGEGLVFAAAAEGKAALLFLKCETDFVARDANFMSTGEELVAKLLSDGPEAVQTLAEKLLPEAVQKLGENISLGEMHLVEAKTVGTYVHSNGKIGVLIGLDSGTTDQAKDAAMHAAAMNPLYINPGDVPAEAVEAERNIWREQLAKEGKPAEILEKIMVGKEQKFRNENALTTQEFVKEPGQSVADALGGAQVTDYVRLAAGV